MFTHVFQNIIRSLLFIFYQAVMHFWFNFHFFSFFKIAFAKSIQLPTSLSKDYFFLNDIAFSALLWFILAKADAKPPKQQIFNDFLQYLRIGASFWNLNDSTHFAFPIGTWKNLNVLISCLSLWLRKSFFI